MNERAKTCLDPAKQAKANLLGELCGVRGWLHSEFDVQYADVVPIAIFFQDGSGTSTGGYIDRLLVIAKDAPDPPFLGETKLHRRDNRDPVQWNRTLRFGEGCWWYECDDILYPHHTQKGYQWYRAQELGIGWPLKPRG